jgi:hypothetical protein
MAALPKAPSGKYPSPAHCRPRRESRRQRAGGSLLSLAAIRRYPLNEVEELDLTPSAHWPEPALLNKPRLEDGPVLVTVECRIDRQQAWDFTLAMQPVQEQRLRDGALRSRSVF